MSVVELDILLAIRNSLEKNFACLHLHGNFGTAIDGESAEEEEKMRTIPISITEYANDDVMEIFQPKS